MSSLSLVVETEQIDRLVKKLSQLDLETFKAIIDRIAGLVGAAMEQHAAIYPPALPNSRYRRTGQLGRSITSEARHEGEYTYAVVGTNLDYAIWVVGPADPPKGEKGQAWMHQGRWTPLDEALQAHFTEYETLIVDELENALRHYFP